MITVGIDVCAIFSGVLISKTKWYEQINFLKTNSQKNGLFSFFSQTKQLFYYIKWEKEKENEYIRFYYLNVKVYSDILSNTNDILMCKSESTACVQWSLEDIKKNYIHTT